MQNLSKRSPGKTDLQNVNQKVSIALRGVLPHRHGETFSSTGVDFAGPLYYKKQKRSAAVGILVGSPSNRITVGLCFKKCGPVFAKRHSPYVARFLTR